MEIVKVNKKPFIDQRVSIKNIYTWKWPDGAQKMTYTISRLRE